MEIPFFSADQLANLEKRLDAADKDAANQMNRVKMEPGEDWQYLEFNALTFLRRLLVEVKHHRAKTEQI